MTESLSYTPREVACAEREWPRAEIEGAFGRFREAIDRSDLGAMAELLEPAGRAGNATYGVVDGRAAFHAFLVKNWHSTISNDSVWVAIDRGRVVNKWREQLPGTPPESGLERYAYQGINELIYAGQGLFCLSFSTPDWTSLRRAYAHWRADGQYEIYGEVFAGG